MDIENNKQEEALKEEKLFEDSLALLSNGHRMTYIFKHVRERATDDEMRSRIMEKITQNNQVTEINDSRLKEATSGKKMDSKTMAGYVVIILVGGFLLYTLSKGFVSIILLFVMSGALAAWGKVR